MSRPEVVIQRGLPEHLRTRAAEVFDEAFAEKLAVVIPDGERRRAFVARTIRPDHCLLALDDDQLLGLVGLNAPRGDLAGTTIHTGGLGLSDWRELLGLVGAIRAAVLLGLFFSHAAKPDELHVDYIAVAAEARGRGVGTALLAETRRMARERSLDYVRLDVVDTNPRARALYEREGYTVVHEERLGIFSRFAGFSAAYTMQQRTRTDELAVDQAGRPRAKR